MIQSSSIKPAIKLKYDWVIKTRADLYWFFPHPPACSFSPNVIYVHSWVDHHFALPRRAARAVMSTVDDYRRCSGVFAHTRFEGWLGAAINAFVGDERATSASGARPALQCRAPHAHASDRADAHAVSGIAMLHLPAAIIRANSSETE